MRIIKSTVGIILSLSIMTTPVYAQETRDWTNEESFVPSLLKQEEGTLTFDFRFMQEQPVQGEHASVVLPENYMVFENTEPVPVYAYTVETDQITDMVLGTVEVEDGEAIITFSGESVDYSIFKGEFNVTGDFIDEQYETDVVSWNLNDKVQENLRLPEKTEVPVKEEEQPAEDEIDNIETEPSVEEEEKPVMEETEPEESPEITPEAAVNSLEEDTEGLHYQAHVQNIGWMDAVNDGEVAGTQGQNLRMEALKIDLDSEEIQYRAHVQNLGWQNWVTSSQMAGTTGQDLRMEAVEIKLTGEMAQKYDIYYRVHVSDYGTLGWAKNGQTAGTTDLNTSMQSIEICLYEKGDVSAPQTGGSSLSPTNKGTLTYQAHVQNIGWQGSVADGDIAGTQKKSLRMEALRIYLNNPEGVEGSIRYKTHVQNIGWQDWVGNGETAGTTGQDLRIEAVQIELTGAMAERYDIYYRVHVSDYGTLGWAKNGEVAGTTDYKKAAQSIEIRLYEKGDSSAPQTGGSYLTPTNKGMITYQAHVENIGWQDSVADGNMAGTQGRSLRMEAMKIYLNNPEGVEGSVRYKAHVQNIGWQNWVNSGQVAGTTGQDLRMEAIQIELTGEMAEKYDIYYRVHVSNYGTLGWAKNGEIAGTMDFYLPVESIEINVYEKDDNSKPVSDTLSYLSGDYVNDLRFSLGYYGTGWENVTQNKSVIEKKDGNVTAFKATLESKHIAGSIEYSVHLQNDGWTEMYPADTILGNLDESKRIESIQIRLSGELTKYYSIYYRAKVENFGWLGWAKNGEISGTTKIGYRLEGLEIRVLPKTAPAPGSSLRHHVDSLYKDAKTALMELPGTTNSIFVSNSGYALTSSERNNLQNIINQFNARGASVGFVMQDIKTGQILAYNPGIGLYSASCIKGPYVLSLLEAGIAPDQRTINTIQWSSNNDYSSLRSSYGHSVFQNWLGAAGVNPIQGSDLYTTTSPVDLAKMWLKGYSYFSGNYSYSAWARQYYQSTLNSMISQRLRGQYTVYSKYGEIALGGYYHVYNDAGIVMAGNSPYTISVMTSLPGTTGHNLVGDLAVILNQIHSNMV